MPKEDLALVVLAAGMGSRFGGVKQVEPVGPNGEILLEYSVFDALKAGFARVVFVVRDDVETTLRTRFARTLEQRCSVAYVPQRVADVPAPFVAPPSRSKPWGTGQAVLACRGAVRGPFAVVNADDFYGAASYMLMSSFLRSPAARRVGNSALVGYELRKTLSVSGPVARGICSITPEGDLASIAERRRVAWVDGKVRYESDEGQSVPVQEGAVASMNFWGFTPDHFALFSRRFAAFLKQSCDTEKEFLISVAVNDMMASAESQVRILPTDEKWLGVTYRADLDWVRARLRELVASGEYPSPLWGGGESRG
jgi:hypothetical protein